MRGTKLKAWQIPTEWKSINVDLSDFAETFSRLKTPNVSDKTIDILLNMANDVREGLLETVGVESSFSLASGRSSIILKLSPNVDAKVIANAIDLENADAWCDEFGQVNLGINPNFSVKDVDQTVLSAIKVIHVMLGLHAVCEVKPKTLKEKILQPIIEILQIQKNISK